MNLSEMRTRVRRDLHDEDAANYRWSDNELDRHIQHALREVSLAIPLEIKASLTTTVGSRELAITSLGDRVLVEAVEYPTGKYPPIYVRFSLWGDTLTLLIDKTPAAAEPVAVYCGKLHTLDATTSTLPSPLEDLVAIGAEGYSALEWATFATNRVNEGGQETWRAYLTWGRERLTAFRKGIATHSQRNAVRARELYAPLQPKASQTTDWGP